jgi:ribosomal protein L37AE/L43A
MEAEQYFKCPVCGKKTLKRKGIKLMWTIICETCFDKMVKNHEEIRRKGNDRGNQSLSDGM